MYKSTSCLILSNLDVPIPHKSQKWIKQLRQSTFGNLGRNTIQQLNWSDIYSHLYCLILILQNGVLYLHQKLEIPTYPNQDDLLNKRSKLTLNAVMLWFKYRHVNKYLLSNYKANDWYTGLEVINLLYYEHWTEKQKYFLANDWHSI